MAAVVDMELCAGCAACVEECPTDSITLNDDGQAIVDAKTCNECGSCVDACPSEAISIPS